MRPRVIPAEDTPEGVLDPHHRKDASMRPRVIPAEDNPTMFAAAACAVPLQ